MASLIHDTSPYYDFIANYVIIRACIMDQRYHTFSFGHYDQAPGASCSILYVLLLSLVRNLYIPFLIYFFTCTIIYGTE